MLKKSLDEKLKYIEHRNDEHILILQHTKDEFDKFTNVIDNLVRLRKEREVAELQENEKKEKTHKEDKKKVDGADKANTKSGTVSNKKSLKPAQSSANIITQKPAKNAKANLTIETGNNSKGKRTQTPGGGSKRTKTEPSNTSRNTMPASSARGSVQGANKSGGNNNRSSSKPSAKKTATSKGKGDKKSTSKGHSEKTITSTNASRPSLSAKSKGEKAITTAKIQPIIESKEETTIDNIKQQNMQYIEQPTVTEAKPKTVLEKIQEKLIISEYIFPYLTEADRMSLLCTNKKLFIKNLQEVFKLKKESKLKSLNVLIGQTIDDKIDELKNVSAYTLYIHIYRVSLKKSFQKTFPSSRAHSRQ